MNIIWKLHGDQEKTIQMLYTRVLQRQKVQITIVEIPYS